MHHTRMLAAALFGIAFASLAQAQNLSIPAGDAAFGRETVTQPSTIHSRDYQGFITGREVRIAPVHHRSTR